MWYLAAKAKILASQHFASLRGSRSFKNTDVGTIESPYATFYMWLILTDIPSQSFRSYRRLLFKFWTVRFWAQGQRTLFILGSLEAHSGLSIRVDWTFRQVLHWRSTSEISAIDWKSAFSLQQGQLGPKFHVEGVAPTNHSSCQKTRLNDLSCGIRMWAQVSFILYPRVWQTDGQKGPGNTCSRTVKIKRSTKTAVL